MLDIIAEVLLWIEDHKFRKRKKARREYERENNLPKKIMIHPFWRTLTILIVILFAGLFIRDYYVVKTKPLAELERIEQILETERNGIGKYPKTLEIIIRNNPLRKNIHIDFWGNEYHYQQLDNGLSYELKSKGKDGILDTDDDIIGNKNLP